MPGKPQDEQREGEMPSIPDGGLSGSMPDWLRRPPAWRTLPDREVAQTTPGTVSTLPDADTSDIDPRTFIQDDDLPEWLRSLRQFSPLAVVDPGPQENSPDARSSALTAPEPNDEKSVATQDVSSPSAFRPRRPPSAESLGNQRSAPTSAPPVNVEIERSWWERAAFTALLGVALLVAIIVIILMVIG